jgi:glutamate-1-semialdehyde 2,1-aminomutase
MHDRPIVDYRSSLPTAEEAAKMTQVHQGLLARGIFCAPTLAGTLSTPMTEADVNAFVNAFAESLGVG